MKAIQHFFVDDIALTETRSLYPIMVVVQARMSSTRLPGKVLLPIMGKPLLFYLVERLRRIKRIDGIIIATSQDTSDDPIAAFCTAESLHCVRGSLDDVLSRMYAASSLFDLQALV